MAHQLGDAALVETLERTLANARWEVRRAQQEVEAFRRMASQGWQPPHPDSREVLEHAAALRRANRCVLGGGIHRPARHDRALGERRPAPRRRAGSRSATRAGPGDPDDPEPPGVDPAGREADSGGRARSATSTTPLWELIGADPDPAAAYRAALERELPERGFPTPLSSCATPREEVEAWNRDALLSELARIRAERRAARILTLRRELRELERSPA